MGEKRFMGVLATAIAVLCIFALYVGVTGIAAHAQLTEEAAAKQAASKAASSEEAMENLKEIYVAGGCFWGVEEYFARIPGVVDAESGCGLLDCRARLFQLDHAIAVSFFREICFCFFK